MKSCTVCGLPTVEEGDDTNRDICSFACQEIFETLERENIRPGVPFSVPPKVVKATVISEEWRSRAKATSRFSRF